MMPASREARSCDTFQHGEARALGRQKRSMHRVGERVRLSKHLKLERHRLRFDERFRSGQIRGDEQRIDTAVNPARARRLDPGVIQQALQDQAARPRERMFCAAAHSQTVRGERRHTEIPGPFAGRQLRHHEIDFASPEQADQTFVVAAFDAHLDAWIPRECL
jgi:hypothetical protein